MKTSRSDREHERLQLLRARTLFYWFNSRDKDAVTLSADGVMRLLALDRWHLHTVLDVLLRLPDGVRHKLEGGVLRLSTLDPDEARAVFYHWRRATKRDRARLTGKRRTAIQARLRQGYTVEELCQAVDGLMTSDWHRGANKRGQQYLDIELVCRDDEHVDRFRSMATAKDQAETQLDKVRQEWAGRREDT
jgi:uncharacterized phage protein (TIGR02220 family)